MTYKELIQDIKHRNQPELSRKASEIQKRVIRSQEQQKRLAWRMEHERIPNIKKTVFDLLEKKTSHMFPNIYQGSRGYISTKINQ